MAACGCHRTSSAADKKPDPSEELCALLSVSVELSGLQRGHTKNYCSGKQSKSLTRLTSSWQLKYRCGRWNTKKSELAAFNHHLFPHLRMTRACSYTAAETLYTTPSSGHSPSLPTIPQIFYLSLQKCKIRSTSILASPASTGRVCSCSKALRLQHCWQCRGEGGKVLQNKRSWSGKAGKQ